MISLSCNLKCCPATIYNKYIINRQYIAEFAFAIVICHVPHNKSELVLWWRQRLGTVIKEINVLSPVLDGEAISDYSLTCLPV